jgi:hypothetical protein
VREYSRCEQGWVSQVEEVFAEGDLPAVAEVLAAMRRCLAVLGDVPEFKDGMARVEVHYILTYITSS